MELQAVTGQLYIQNGEAQPTSPVPGLLAQSAPAKTARGRERDFLFVHLSLSGQPDETAVLAQDLLDAISLQFYRSTGSVTAALRRGLVKANELLLRLNLSGAGQTREGAISCAALHNGELFILQAGEALALLGHNFGVERVPQELPDRVTPLGRSAGLDIRFNHYHLQSGDMLLLIDPRITHLPTQSLSPALVEAGVEYGLELLSEAVGDDSARLLLIEFTDQAPADLPDIGPPERAGGEALAMIPPPGPIRESGTATVAEPGMLAAQLQTSTGPRARPSSAEKGRPAPAIDVETTARRATSEAALGLSHLTSWLAGLLTRLRPSPRSQDKPAGQAIPGILAVVIPLIVAVIVTSVYLQRGQVRRFAEIKNEIGQSLAAADAAGDEGAEARLHYRNAVTLAAEAETIRPGDPEVARLRQQALSALDLLENVTRLNASPFYVYGEETNLAAVVLREGFNGGIFTLDAANNTVYLHETDEAYANMLTLNPEPIVFGGQAVGNRIVGSMVDIMWRPQGNAVTRDGLAILDRSGALLTYYPNFGDIRAVPLGLASEWRLPLSITTYDERLYILDAGAREIWKYFPDGDGFVLRENESAIVLDEEANLEQAVDIAIYSEDGSLVVLYSNGRLRYYDTRSGRVQWDQDQLLQNGLSSPLVTPIAVEIVGRGLNASLFIADPGSSRIIQVSRGGTVLAQYRATDISGQELFGRITDFAVSDLPLRIFVTAGDTLYLASQE